MIKYYLGVVILQSAIHKKALYKLDIARCVLPTSLMRDAIMMVYGVFQTLLSFLSLSVSPFYLSTVEGTLKLYSHSPREHLEI